MAKKGLPKKYAKMGFKKGWAEYKKAQGKTTSKPSTRKKSKSSSITKYSSRNMAKKKRTSTRRKSTKVVGLDLGKMAGPVVYGALRSKISNMLAPVTAKVPLGAISDEVVMYGAGALAKKFAVKRAGPVRNIINDGQKIELAMIGSEIANGNVNLGFLSNIFGGSTSETSNGNLF